MMATTEQPNAEQLTMPYEQRRVWELLPDRTRNEAERLLGELMLAVATSKTRSTEPSNEER